MLSCWVKILQTLAANEVHPGNDMRNYLWDWPKKFQDFKNSNTVESCKFSMYLNKLNIQNSNWWKVKRRIISFALKNECAWIALFPIHISRYLSVFLLHGQLAVYTSKQLHKTSFSVESHKIETINNRYLTIFIFYFTCLVVDNIFFIFFASLHRASEMRK